MVVLFSFNFSCPTFNVPVKSKSRLQRKYFFPLMRIKSCFCCFSWINFINVVQFKLISCTATANELLIIAELSATIFSSNFEYKIRLFINTGNVTWHTSFLQPGRSFSRRSRNGTQYICTVFMYVWLTGEMWTYHPDLFTNNSRSNIFTGWTSYYSCSLRATEHFKHKFIRLSYT